MSKDDRGRIVPLQFITDRRVLGGIPGGGEVAVGGDDPRSRNHPLPRHATVLALQRLGDARLPLATRRKAYVPAFRAVDLVVIAPPGEKSHTQAGPGADHSDGRVRLGLAGLQRLQILSAQERNAVADRGEVVNEGARRDPDHGPARTSRVAAARSRNQTPCRARAAGMSLAAVSPSSARATAGALSLPVTRTAMCRAAAMTGGVIVIRRGGGFGLSTTTTRRSCSVRAGEPGKREAVCPSAPMPSTSTSSAAGSWWS